MADQRFAPGNRVEYYRVEVLGWSREELAFHAQTSGHRIATKTIARVETSHLRFARKTFTLIYNALASALKQTEKNVPSFEEVFPMISRERKPVAAETSVLRADERKPADSEKSTQKPPKDALQ